MHTAYPQASMSTAYSQQASPPHDMHRGSIPNIPDAGYRPAAGGPQYPISQHSMPVPQQSQINQPYSDPFNPLAATRPPVPEQIHAEAGLAPLQPGMQPAAIDPLPRSCVENGWRYDLKTCSCGYRLKVVQEPQRARMCGFGDKDRRPITPPPCVRLIISDATTGKEIDVNDIDHGMFVLNVDLWDHTGNKEVNLVRHSTSPSITLGTPVSYSQVAHGSSSPAYCNNLPVQGGGPVKFEHGQGPSYQTPSYNPYPGPPQVTPFAQPPQGPPPTYNTPQQYNPGYPPPTNGPPPYQSQNGYGQPAPQPMFYQGHPMQGGMDYPVASQQLPSQSYGGRQFAPADMSLQRMPVNTTSPGGMFTRNLIGSLAASAFRLTDPHDRIGIWFVMQDLSVRTEGTFRLRFSFVNVGVPNSSPTSATPGGQPANGQSMTINTGRAPVLAACFSECFTVYSAKRFPGVVESTPLSKCFATQGIKIPIRKDGQGPGRAREDKEYDED
ncbi:Velvet complex subunit 2 [Lachnellula cervina]|uniref:Velvet complex subunit 2 n=1 Tax=Lachnellula cervina TaxID=1316786 RepID=A0A7D8UMR9_9HELO|nr:Velvet complex subunit 2 [Lachnellula cervina]